MENKCFIKKIEGVIPDNELLKFGEMRVYFPVVETVSDSTNMLTISFNKETTLIVTNGYFTDSTFQSNEGTTKLISANNQTPIYISNTGATLHIFNKYDLLKLACKNNWTTKVFKFGLDDLSYSSSLTALDMKMATSIFGVLGGNFPSLNIIYFTGLSSVDLDNFNAPNITSLTSGAKGNIQSISSCTKLLVLNINGKEVVGTLESFLNEMAESRSSGYINISLDSTLVTYNGELISSSIHVNFGTDMVSPTEVETAQGWQITT